MRQIAYLLPPLLLAFSGAPTDNSALAQPQCRLCSDAENERRSKQEKASTPLRISVQAGLEFNKIVIAGRSAGEVSIDPVTGSSQSSANVVNLGGLVLKGTAHLRGEPGRLVRVILPPSITLTSPTGGQALLTELETDLNVAPRLDANGELTFNFGGKLNVQGNTSGNFRGRIPITAEYI